MEYVLAWQSENFANHHKSFQKINYFIGYEIYYMQNKWFLRGRTLIYCNTLITLVTEGWLSPFNEQARMRLLNIYHMNHTDLFFIE